MDCEEIAVTLRPFEERRPGEEGHPLASDIKAASGELLGKPERRVGDDPIDAAAEERAAGQEEVDAGLVARAIVVDVAADDEPDRQCNAMRRGSRARQ